MPLPSTSKVGKIMRFLKKEKPGMKLDQKRAISLNQARKYGADIPLAKEAVRRATA